MKQNITYFSCYLLVIPGYLVVTSGDLVVTCGYLIATTDYLSLLITYDYFSLLHVPRFNNKLKMSIKVLQNVKEHSLFENIKGMGDAWLRTSNKSEILKQSLSKCLIGNS